MADVDSYSSSSSSSSGRQRAAYSQRTSSPSLSSGRQPTGRSHRTSSPSLTSGIQHAARSHKVSSPGLSANELKAQLYHSFRERGLVDSLKSQLRTKLVAELQQSALVAPRSIQEQEGLQDGGSLLHRAANSLVADHLKRCGYDYTLAVFLPESESAKDKLFTLQDLLDLLKIHQDSKLGKKLLSAENSIVFYNNPNRKKANIAISDLSSYHSKGLLWQFLCEVARSHRGGSEEKGIQVDEHPSHLTSIESKLKSVDVLFNSKAEEENLTQHGAMQDKLLSLQRQMEARCKMETNMEISRFKESELKRVELEERDKCRKEIARARKEMEYTYRAKSEALQERERSAMDRLQKERKHVERETYAQRQSLLEELQVLRQRESELKREADVNARAAKLEEDRCKTMEENLKIREASVANIQETYDRRLKEQTRQFELEMQAKYSDRIRELDERDSKLRGEKRNLQQESEALKGLKDDIQDKQTRLNELETLLQQMRHDAITAEKRNEVLNEKLRDRLDYPTVKETNAVLRRELDNTKLRLSEIVNEQKMERARHEELLKQMAEQLSRPSPEMVTLQGDLARARQQIQQEKAVVDHRETQMRTKLQDEREQNLELRRQLEEQSKQMTEMNNQMSDLRAALRETQTALSNEIFRRPAPPAAVAGSPTHSDHVPVHDQGVPEDQYIDTILRQPRIDPQLLLGSEGNNDMYTPMTGLVTTDAPHQSHTVRQRLLADEDSHGVLPPMAGLDTTGPRRLLADEGNSGMFAPMAGLEATASEEGEVSADNSLAFLEETRQRFRQLEKEAENLEQTYQNFQHRVTNPHAVHTSPVRNAPMHQSGIGRPLGSLEFATPAQSRHTGSGQKATRHASPPEQLVEYPLRDSMESSTVSQQRTFPHQKRETLAGTRMGVINQDIQATPLESFPLEDTMDSTKFLGSRKTVQSDSAIQSEIRQDVPLHKRAVQSVRTVTLPSYESSVHDQPGRMLPLPRRDQQTDVPSEIPRVTEQRSQVTHRTSPTHSDRSSNMKLNLPPKNGDASNLPDQSQLTIKSRRESSVSSLSEHSLPSEHQSLTHTPPPYKPPGTLQVGKQPQGRQNDSSSEDDLTGGSLSQLSGRESTGAAAHDQSQAEEERLRKLREEEEREEREWEEKRKQKEEERKRREQEAREREHRMLMELQNQEETQAQQATGGVDVQDEIKDAEEEKVETKGDEEETGQEAKDDTEDLNIDPVMQKYMQMVQQRKQQDTGSKVQKSDEDVVDQKASILSGLSQGSISAEEMGGVDKPSSHGASSDEDDPFDDW